MSDLKATVQPIDGQPISPPGTSEPLGLALIWAYTLPRIGFGIMGLLFSTYLMKYATDVLLIAPAAMGTVLAISRIWDGVSDPLVGYLSDRTRSRLGRRRSWLFLSAVPIAIGLVMIWSPPQLLSGWSLIAWMVLALLVYETASTAFFIPHGALGVELTPDYHERTRLFGYSHMFTAVGAVLGLIALYLMNEAGDKREFALWLTVIAGSCIAALIIYSTFIVPERSEYQGRGSESMFGSFLGVWRNIHARLLLIVYGIETFGAAVIGMLVPYLIAYVIPETDMGMSKSAYMIAILLTYTVPQFIFTPLWIRLARRIGKKRLWAISMFSAAVILSAISSQFIIFT
ncbi:MAG: MFS transporter [Pseudomonadales bacterium]|nr:MFS transporter [Pseudomonadales bacterium]